MEMLKIFIVEDDEDLSFIIAEALKKQNYRVICFHRSLEFFSYIEKEKPDLLIVDIMLPDFDGFRIVRFLKNRPDLKDIPVIFVTAKISEEDKLRGFELGADDYVTKPFSIRELVARVNAVIRRSKALKRKGIYIFEGFELDTERIKVKVEGKDINLTHSEFKILSCLVENYGKPLSRDRIIEEVWGIGKDVTDRTVDVHIKHIREKLGNYAKYIKTVRGFGYKFEA